MRSFFLAGVALVAAITCCACRGCRGIAPKDIQATFFTGQPFTASASNVKYKMVFTADGKMTREPIGSGGSKGEGTWKLERRRVLQHLEGLEGQLLHGRHRRRQQDGR